jgi:TonB family protein
MRRTVSLSEFMPYGAPELLAARRPHLALALTISSAMAVMLFVVALRVTPIVRIVTPPRCRGIGEHQLSPPPAEPEAFKFDHQTKIANPRDGIIVPARDEDFQQIWDDDGTTSSANGGGGKGVVAPGDENGVIETPSDALPEFGIYVPVDELPNPVTQVKPVYPELAREAGVEGFVIVHALIGRDGHVLRVQADSKLSNPLFNDAALDAARRWVFTPALANGHAVAVWLAIPFRFVLHE